MRYRLSRSLAVALLTVPTIAVAQEGRAPETFIANAQAEAQSAGVSAVVTIQIDRYTDERDLTTMLEALRLGGYPRLLPVLRSMPVTGSVELNGRKASIRWVRQTPTANGRTISVVTDTPLAFVGGSAVDAKPRAGFELAFLLLEVDSSGVGNGTMAAAARIRPGGPTGVQIDDYAETPVKLVTVRKSPR
jgi:hypothetical protein